MTKLLKLTFIVSSLTLLFLSYSTVVLANPLDPLLPSPSAPSRPTNNSSSTNAGASSTNPTSATPSQSGGGGEFFSSNFKEYLPKFYLWALVVGGALSVAVLIWAGFDYATSAGNVEMINQAKDKIVGAILGLLVLLLAALILRALGASA